MFVCRASLPSLYEGRRCADGCVREPSARSLIYITLHHGGRRGEQLCLTHKLSHTDDNSPPQFSELWPISLLFCIYSTPRCFLLLSILVIISFPVHIFAPSYCVCMYVFICLCVYVYVCVSEELILKMATVCLGIVTLLLFLSTQTAFLRKTVFLQLVFFYSLTKSLELPQPRKAWK